MSSPCRTVPDWGVHLRFVSRIGPIRRAEFAQIVVSRGTRSPSRGLRLSTGPRARVGCRALSALSTLWTGLRRYRVALSANADNAAAI